MLTKTGTFLNLVGTRNFLVAIYELWTKDIHYLYECKENWIMNGRGHLRFK